MKKFYQLLLLAGVTLSLSACQSTNMDRGGFGSFMRSLNHTSYGYQQVVDPTGTAPGKIVERFEVQPGDCSSNSGWSDCANDRERSELSEASKGQNVGANWYGWSIYAPDDYNVVFPAKVALGQFHQDKSHPVWMFQNGFGGYWLDDQVTGTTRKLYPLIDKKDFKGKWHKIEVNVKWTMADDGFFKVWVDGEQKVDYKGKTTSNNKPYFKYGVYRSFLKRYAMMNKGKKAPAQVIYYANVKKGNRREDLAPTIMNANK